MHGPRRWESWNRSAENKRASRLASHEGVDVAKFWGPNPDCVPCELVYLPLRPPGKPSALDGICMRIKGNKQAKKEDVVVAYGAEAAPVKKLRKRLRRYVTVVSVDERRTSRVCSKQNEEQRARTDLGEEEDENGGSSSTAETGVREEDDAGSNRGLIHIHAQRNANGDKGPSLHLLFYNKCHTVWNRDVNTARNIAWIFW
ncbi:hypothetical protein V1521DRAFT_447233 [Lipomyces starkeyi]